MIPIEQYRAAQESVPRLDMIIAQLVECRVLSKHIPGIERHLAAAEKGVTAAFNQVRTIVSQTSAGPSAPTIYPKGSE